MKQSAAVHEAAKQKKAAKHSTAKINQSPPRPHQPEDKATLPPTGIQQNSLSPLSGGGSVSSQPTAGTRLFTAETHNMSISSDREGVGDGGEYDSRHFGSNTMSCVELEEARNEIDRLNKELDRERVKCTNLVDHREREIKKLAKQITEREGANQNMMGEMKAGNLVLKEYARRMEETESQLKSHMVEARRKNLTGQTRQIRD